MSSDPLLSIAPAEEFVAALTAAGQTVATAESLTAGLVAATIASVPGASNVLRGGVVVYGTDLKSSLGGVPEAELASEGAVSESTAAHLATHIRAVTGADWGVSLTGVAGPDRQEGHPAGTVFIGISSAAGISVRLCSLTGDRWDIRSAAVSVCLSEVLTRLSGGLGNQTRVE